MTVHQVTVDLNDLGWADLEKIEEYAGHPIGNELVEKNPSMRTIRALTLWAMRRDDPGLTDAAFAELPLSSMNVSIKGAALPPLAESRTKRRYVRHSPTRKSSQPSVSSTVSAPANSSV